jgi:hypothetical protein
MRLLPSGIIATALSGCAMSSGILPAGPDAYTVTERFAPIRGGATTAQQTALTEANSFCAEQGRQFTPLDMKELASANLYGSTSYAVTFRCLRWCPSRRTTNRRTRARGEAGGRRSFTSRLSVLP